MNMEWQCTSQEFAILNISPQKKLNAKAQRDERFVKKFDDELCRPYRALI